MKTIAPFAVAALLLSGCATVGSTFNTPHAVAERSESDAETAYQATVATLDTLMASNKISHSKYYADWNAAWKDLQAVRTAYNAGQSITALVAKVQDDQAAAKGIQ